MTETTYPERPGFKTGGTSAEAAQAMKNNAQTLRDGCLELLKTRGDLTADECAGLMNEGVLSIRPRLTELFQMGLVFKTNLRRKNASGLSAIVWTTGPQANLF